MKEFPVLNKKNKDLKSIPWGLIAQHEYQAKINHGGQSLCTLAERGGLTFEEILAVLENRKFSKDSNAEHKVFIMVEKYLKTVDRNVNEKNYRYDLYNESDIHCRECKRTADPYEFQLYCMKLHKNVSDEGFCKYKERRE